MRMETVDISVKFAFRSRPQQFCINQPHHPEDVRVPTGISCVSKCNYTYAFVQLRRHEKQKALFMLTCSFARVATPNSVIGIAPFINWWNPPFIGLTFRQSSVANNLNIMTSKDRTNESRNPFNVFRLMHDEWDPPSFQLAPYNSHSFFAVAPGCRSLYRICLSVRPTRLFVTQKQQVFGSNPPNIVCTYLLVHNLDHSAGPWLAVDKSWWRMNGTRWKKLRLWRHFSFLCLMLVSTG